MTKHSFIRGTLAALGILLVVFPGGCWLVFKMDSQSGYITNGVMSITQMVFIICSILGLLSIRIAWKMTKGTPLNIIDRILMIFFLGIVLIAGIWCLILIFSPMFYRLWM